MKYDELFYSNRMWNYIFFTCRLTSTKDKTIILNCNAIGKQKLHQSQLHQFNFFFHNFYISLQLDSFILGVTSSYSSCAIRRETLTIFPAQISKKQQHSIEHKTHTYFTFEDRILSDLTSLDFSFWSPASFILYEKRYIESVVYNITKI